MAITNEDTCVIKSLFSEKIDDIKQAGIVPEFEQIEMFSYLLPEYSFTKILDILISICTISKHFFLCQLEDIKKMAEYIENFTLSLRVIFKFILIWFLFRIVILFV